MPSWVSVLLSVLPLLLKSPLGQAVAVCVATQSGWQAIGACILTQIASNPPTPNTAEHHAVMALKTAIEQG